MVKKYLVVEVDERDVVSTYILDTEELAREKANELLRAHIVDIGYLDEFEGREHDGGYDWSLAGEDNNSEAWCNLAGRNWDAHICEVEIEPQIVMPVG